MLMYSSRYYGIRKKTKKKKNTRHSKVIKLVQYNLNIFCLTRRPFAFKWISSVHIVTTADIVKLQQCGVQRKKKQRSKVRCACIVVFNVLCIVVWSVTVCRLLTVDCNIPFFFVYL